MTKPTDRIESARKILNAPASTIAELKAAEAVHRSQLLQLELEERRGKLMQVRKVEDALAAAGEKIVRITDQLPMDADDLATSVARGGAQALRHALKEISRRMRTRIADALSLESTISGINPRSTAEATRARASRLEERKRFPHPHARLLAVGELHASGVSEARYSFSGVGRGAP
jgi:hypothetical protein